MSSESSDFNVTEPVSSAKNVFSLNCLILGENIEHVFEVKIAKTAKVSALRDEIKTKKPITFERVDASDINVYQVSFPFDERLAVELGRFQLVEQQPLYPVKRLESIFPNWQKDHLHIIVELPLSTVSSAQDVFSLNCLILGQNSVHVFEVKIAKTAKVSALRDEIKAKEPIVFERVGASGINVYQVSFPFDEFLDDALDNFNAVQPLKGMQVLSGIFSDPFLPGNLHIIVGPPEGVGTQAQIPEEKDVLTKLYERFRRTCELRSEDKSPSEAAKSSEYIKIQRSVQNRIYDGRYARDRPADTNGPPIQLFNPAFAHFSSKAFDPDYHVPPDFIRRVRDLVRGFSAIHHRARGHANHLEPLWERLLAQDLTSTRVNHGKSVIRGVEFSSNKPYSIYLAIFEEENEFGGGGADPSVQASLSFRRLYAKAEQLRNRCCCPTFLIAHAGPWLAVLGGVITTKCIVQRLTDFIWIPVHSVGDDQQYLRIGRILYALRESIQLLETWYQTMFKTIEPCFHPAAHPRFFPTPNMYLRDGVPVKFKYLRPLEKHTSCMTYLAKTREDKSINIVVKFVTRYGGEAHRYMAEAGFAPKLFYHGPVNVDDSMPSYGDLRMVVMEYVDGRTLHSAELDKFPLDLQDQVQRGIECLHDGGFVFGDLRGPNIMIAQGKVLLIDFDWAGKEGEVKYPVSLSTSIVWPEGAKALELIRKEHDIDMLDALYPVLQMNCCA